MTTTPDADPANNMGVSNLIWEIRRCRRCELIMDNWYRYWDLIRWHQLDKLDSTKYPNIMLGANVSNVPNCEEATKMATSMLLTPKFAPMKPDSISTRFQQHS